MTSQNAKLQQTAFDYIETHRPEMLELLKRLVLQESYSDDVGDVNKVIETIACEMKDNYNIRVVEFKDAGSTIIATSGAEYIGAPITFIGHCDTVHPSGSLSGNMPLRFDENGKIYGPGVVDMKGGIVIALYAVKALRSAGYNYRPFKIIISGDEEVGHIYSESAKIIQDESRGSAATFVCETGYPDNKMIIERKGTGRFTVESFGRSAHAGICPEKGCHAILDMARRIEAIQELNRNDDGVTYNVGVISGGVVPNAIPDHCKIDIDIRYTDENQIPGILKKLKTVSEKTYVEGVTSKLSGGIHFLPMKATNKNRALFSIICEAAEQLGEPAPYAASTGGASDAAYASSVDVPTVCSLGIQGGLSHTREEYAFVESLYTRTKLLITTILIGEEKMF